MLQTEAQALSIPLGSETLHATRAKNDGTLVTHLSGEGVQVFGAREALKRHPRRVCHPPRKLFLTKKKTRFHADIGEDEGGHSRCCWETQKQD